MKIITYVQNYISKGLSVCLLGSVHDVLDLSREIPINILALLLLHERPQATRFCLGFPGRYFKRESRKVAS